MKVDLPLGVILAMFLAMVVAGCGDQLNNPVASEQDYNSLEYYKSRRGSRAGLVELNRSPGGNVAARTAGGMPLTLVMQDSMRNDPYSGFRFRVEIDGIAQAGFSEVILPDLTVDATDGTSEESELHPEYGNLILKKGVTDSMELYNWHREALNGNIERKNVSVILMDDEGNDRCRWDFYEAWPIRYVAPELDVQGNDVAIETFEIAYGVYVPRTEGKVEGGE